MKTKTRSLLPVAICLLCLSVTTVFGQTKAFNDVLKLQLRNMGPIIKNNNVTGYYMFYKVDKVDRKNNSYLLRILDENLNEVGSDKIIQSKYFYLVEAA